MGLSEFQHSEYNLLESLFLCSHSHYVFWHLWKKLNTWQAPACARRSCSPRHALAPAPQPSRQQLPVTQEKPWLTWGSDSSPFISSPQTPTKAMGLTCCRKTLAPVCHDFSILASLPKAIFFFITWFRFLRDRKSTRLNSSH